MVNPIVDPPLHAEFVVIQPARRTLSVPARLFLERFEAEIAHIQRVWGQALAPQRPRGGAAGRGARKVAAPRCNSGLARVISGSSPRKR